MIGMFQSYDSLEDKCSCTRGVKAFCEPCINIDQEQRDLESRPNPLEAYNEALE